MLNINNTIARNDSIVDAQIDGEIVMMDINNGEYYGLDVIAARIWELMASPKIVSEICEILQQEYKVSEEKCQKDVLGFIDKMIAKGVITIAE